MSNSTELITKFHSAQQNELYPLIQVIHLHPYSINIVSDSLYSVFILGNIETSIIYSNEPIIQQLFLELEYLIRDCTSIYITHIRTHSCLPGPMTHGINKLINLLLLLLPRNNMLYYTIILGPYTKFEKFHTAIPKKKKIIKNFSTCRPLHLQPIIQGINP